MYANLLICSNRKDKDKGILSVQRDGTMFFCLFGGCFGGYHLADFRVKDKNYTGYVATTVLMVASL